MRKIRGGGSSVANRWLSIGGNDAELIWLLNSCIFQVAIFNPEQVIAAKVVAATDKEYAWAKDFDWEKIGRTCSGQVTISRTIAASAGFKNSLDRVLVAAKSKLAPGYVLHLIYILMPH